MRAYIRRAVSAPHRGRVGSASVSVLTLQLFGGCALVSNGETLTGPAAQRRRLALLAVLAGPTGAAVSRDKLVAYFWPEEDRDRARRFLSDSLFTLRKLLGKDVLLTTGDDVRINVKEIEVDVLRFDRLLAVSDFETAVDLYRGPFLDGFFISDAPEFERWAEVQRARLARLYASALEQLATKSESDGDWTASVEWWRRLSAHDPHAARVAIGTMRALAATGDVGGALITSRDYVTRMRDELGAEPDPAVLAFESQLRTRRVPGSHIAIADLPASAPPPVVRPRAAAAPTIATRRLTLWHVRLFAAAAVLAVASILTWRIEPATSEPGATSTSSAVLSAAGSVRSFAGRTAFDEAREFYQQGRYYLTKGQFDPDIHRHALELFQRSIERDSTYAPAYAGMADVYNHADDPTRAKAAALKAIALTDTLAEAYTALAYVLAFYEYQWAAADSALQHAIEIDPRYVLAHLRRANVLAALGQIGEASDEVERARKIQPESFVVLLNRGHIAALGGHPEEAITLFNYAIGLEPDRIDSRHMLVREYWRQKKYAEAQAALRAMGNSAGAEAMSGDPSAMARFASSYSVSGPADSVRLAAAIYVRLGNLPKAFELLDRLHAARDKFLPTEMRNEPFASLRSDPRYRRLLARMNLP
jgi:DNA-binding SARP family transcriptional activator/tetratricopeptide (TPR) repeat protein